MSGHEHWWRRLFLGVAGTVVCKAGHCGSSVRRFSLVPGSCAAPALPTCPISFQIARLEQTWMVLRQRHTEGAILYEKKLKPFLKSLNEGKGNRSNSLCLTCFLLPPFVWAWPHFEFESSDPLSASARHPLAAELPQHSAKPIWPCLPLSSQGSIS